MEPRWSWFRILKVIPIALSIASGSASVGRDFMLLSGKAPNSNTAFWAWLRICFVASFAIAWLQEHMAVKAAHKRVAALEGAAATWRLSENQKGKLLSSLRKLQLHTASMRETIRSKFTYEVVFNCHFNALPLGRTLASDIRSVFAEAGWVVRQEINPTNTPHDAFGLCVCKATPVIRQAVIDSLNAIGVHAQEENVPTPAPEVIVLPLDITIGQKID